MASSFVFFSETEIHIIFQLRKYGNGPLKSQVTKQSGK